MAKRGEGRFNDNSPVHWRGYADLDLYGRSGRAYNKRMEKKPILLLQKKNPCPDCDFCQGCSETRCSLCKSLDCPSSKKAKKKKEHVPLFRKF